MKKLLLTLGTLTAIGLGITVLSIAAHRKANPQKNIKR